MKLDFPGRRCPIEPPLIKEQGRYQGQDIEGHIKSGPVWHCSRTYVYKEKEYSIQREERMYSQFVVLFY